MYTLLLFMHLWHLEYTISHRLREWFTNESVFVSWVFLWSYVCTLAHRFSFWKTSMIPRQRRLTHTTHVFDCFVRSCAHSCLWLQTLCYSTEAGSRQTRPGPALFSSEGGWRNHGFPRCFYKAHQHFQTLVYVFMSDQLLGNELYIKTHIYNDNHCMFVFEGWWKPKRKNSN